MNIPIAEPTEETSSLSQNERIKDTKASKFY